MSGFLDGLRQPEYLHVLLNPLPVYGLATGTLALAAALISRSRAAILIALGIIALTAGSAWPVYALGQQAYETVNTTVDPAGQDWLDAHKHRAEALIWTFYGLAALAAAAIVLPLKWPKTLTPWPHRPPRRARGPGRGRLHCLRGRQGAPPGIQERSIRTRVGMALRAGP